MKTALTIDVRRKQRKKNERNKTIYQKKTPNLSAEHTKNTQIFCQNFSLVSLLSLKQKPHKKLSETELQKHSRTKNKIRDYIILLFSEKNTKQTETKKSNRTEL